MQTAIAARKRNRGARRNIAPLTALRLWATAGGRCTFPGCNEWILQDNLTLRDAKLGHIAHIVGAEENGPRGKHPMPLVERNDFRNLTLMCFKHHELIDDAEDAYPVDMLQRWKCDHESRIRRLTGIQSECKTTVLRMTAMIGDRKPTIPFEQICAAIEPRYPADECGIEIDRTQLPEPQHPDYWALGARLIDERIAATARPVMAGTPISHLSAFALAPIPFLVHLGATLGSLAQVDLFQRHRDSNDWLWKPEPDPGSALGFSIGRPTVLGSRDVLLSISMSGKIHADDLPAELRDLPVYEINPTGRAADPTILRTQRELQQFRRTYAEVIATVRRENPDINMIHLCAAVPAPVAVMCGIELLPKVHPTLAVYDFHRRTGTFQFALRANQHDR